MKKCTYQTLVAALLCFASMHGSSESPQAQRQSPVLLRLEQERSRLMKANMDDLDEIKGLLIGYGVMRECKDAQGAVGLPPVPLNIVEEYCQPTDEIMNQYCPCNGMCFCPPRNLQWNESRVLDPNNKATQAWKNAATKQEIRDILEEDAFAQATEIVRNASVIKKVQKKAVKKDGCTIL